MTEGEGRGAIEVEIGGVPNAKQAEFFRADKRFIAYGGARGGGKSWALRRKLIGLCLVYPGIRCLLVRRSFPELRSNHLLPLLREYGALLDYSETRKTLSLANGSMIELGYCADDGDALRYQGQEYDVIAIDEATQLSEFRFSIFKACLRGTRDCPRRMYLTCNPGGIGHAYIKRLFIDRQYHEGEDPDDYCMIRASVYDNDVLLSHDAGYVRMLESLPPRLRDAWLYGRWDVFDGQFFPEFDPALHVCKSEDIPVRLRKFLAFDYGLDMLAALVIGVDQRGGLWVVKECARANLTLREAAEEMARLCAGERVEYAVASPDLWNRRQDSGRSGFEVMQGVRGMPPMTPADDRRVPGWRMVREYLNALPGNGSGEGRTVGLRIYEGCGELIRCLPLLLCDGRRNEDASGEPHAVTHAPEALRYGVMSRCPSPSGERGFTFGERHRGGYND